MIFFILIVRTKAQSKRYKLIVHFCLLGGIAVKKNKLLLVFASLLFLFLISDKTYAIETSENSSTVETETSSASSQTTQTESSTSAASSIQETNDSQASTTDTSNKEQAVVQAASATGQDTDGFWLVDSAATLTEYLKDSQKLHFRLTADIDLGTTGFALKDGVIIDGAGHIVTYNSGSSSSRGFYVNQANATVEIRNTQFGYPDGTGAIGYYGIISGGSAVNMTFIFDTIKYYSNNGQMIYNQNGSVIMKGENEIVQEGTGSYSEEWAETNYVEIQSGHTSIKHSSTKTRAFIWAQSTSSGNPYANTAQLIVKENAALDIQTNGNMTYGRIPPTYTVEKNAKFTLDKVSLATDSTRNQFFNSTSIPTINFDFQENSTGVFTLPLEINVGSASGGFSIGSGATVSISTPNSAAFSASSSSQFGLSLTNPELVTFSSNTLGTLGLNAASGTTFGNLNLSYPKGVRIDTYANATDTTAASTFYTANTSLNVSGATFKNTTQSSDQLATTELNALGSSKKIVFSKRIYPASDLTVGATNITATSADLAATSNNNGSAATEVKYLLFSSESDLGQVTKARHIIRQTTFDSKNTTADSSYTSSFNELNPNTTYWLQAVITNGAGQSDFSPAQKFSTAPALDSMAVNGIDVTKAVVEGDLASDTGKWTDYSAGENSPVPDQPVTYGGQYTSVQVDYSTDQTFPSGTTQSVSATLSGDKKQKFSASLSGLSSSTTYYVRVRATGVSGVEQTLATTPVTSFKTLDEVIDVDVPLEMIFETHNKDIGTATAGQLYSPTYQITSKSTIPIQVSLIGLIKENQSAQQISLLDTLASPSNTNALALQVVVDQDTENATFITDDLATKPLVIGQFSPKGSTEKSIAIGGKYFNPTGDAVTPAYQSVFKVEKIAE